MLLSLFHYQFLSTNTFGVFTVIDDSLQGQICIDQHFLLRGFQPHLQLLEERLLLLQLGMQRCLI